jgi:mediator of RNA polymerase II transcription subunit 12
MTYSLSLELLRPFYSEGLVDSRTFLVWLVQQLGVSNLAQVGFMVRLADEYLDGIMKNRALARPFIDACLCKLSEVCKILAFFHLAQLGSSDPLQCNARVSCQHRVITKNSSSGIKL